MKETRKIELATLGGDGCTNKKISTIDIQVDTPTCE